MSDSQSIDSLIEVLRQGEWQAQRKASELLAEMGAPAVTALIALLGTYRTFEDYNANPNPHSQAEDALIAIGEPAVEPLIATLNDESWGGVHGAILCLREIGDVRAVQPLIELLARDDQGIALEVGDALRAFGEAAVRPLIFALKNNERVRRENVVSILGRMGDPLAIPALIEVLKTDDNLTIRCGAASALTNFNDPRTVEALISALEVDKADEVRDGAAYGLGKIGDARAIEPLIAATRDRAPATRETVVRALGELALRLNAPRAIEPLLHAMRDDDDWGTRQSAAEMLIKLETGGVVARHRDEAKALLMADLHNDDEEVRLGAAYSLKEVRDPQAVDALVRLLYHWRTDISVQAALGLGELGDARAIPALTAAMNHREERVRNAVQQAISRLEADNPPKV